MINKGIGSSADIDNCATVASAHDPGLKHLMDNITPVVVPYLYALSPSGEGHVKRREHGSARYVRDNNLLYFLACYWIDHR